MSATWTVVVYGTTASSIHPNATHLFPSSNSQRCHATANCTLRGENVVRCTLRFRAILIFYLCFRWKSQFCDFLLKYFGLLIGAPISTLRALGCIPKWPHCLTRHTQAKTWCDLDKNWPRGVQHMARHARDVQYATILACGSFECQGYLYGGWGQ